MNASPVLFTFALTALLVSVQAFLCNKQVVAPDGSTYDMSPFQKQLHHTDAIGSDGQIYIYNISICGTLPEYCGSCGDSSACQIYKENLYGKKHEICLGQLDSSSTITGLNNNMGVVIHYKNGEYCSECSPKAQHEIKITLYCTDEYAEDEIELESATIFEDDNNALVLVNGTMSCRFDAHLEPQTSYYSYDNLCNGTKASIVKAKTELVQKCVPGCRLLDNMYIFTTCIRKFELPRGDWVQETTYDNQWCDFAMTAEYRRIGTCLGTEEFSYEECVNGQRVWYDCGYDSQCNTCVPKIWLPTDTCLTNVQYKCIHKR